MAAWASAALYKSSSWRKFAYARMILGNDALDTSSYAVDEANVDKSLRQFTYKDSDQYVFMDMESYEESRLNASDVGDKSKWLKEGMECNVLTWNGRVIDVEVPLTVKLQVSETDPGMKGDTAQGGSKPATLETGAVVNVPLFINIGEVIAIDTRSGTYSGRA
ncbi:hypothetical protein GOP47_0023447 [Adiantum capillus-veneris]|uniref:Elongation factor P n=1 Tax=Adiantum capillus-veneris TaxID=13818 RepID=A0A9D4U4J4_ADICA|nr:hypothetical protein GOP47_0023447 [Adiantum capillus-veneris]